MWRLIDKEMSLKECSVYCYSPDEDPYDGEEGAIWSFNYFFFNKARKRVCYIYLRGLSIISHSPAQRTPMKTKRSADDGWSQSDISGAGKRARYWLGDRANNDVSSGWGEDDDEQDIIAAPYDDDEVEVLEVLDDGDEPRYVLSADEAGSPYSERSGRSMSKGTVRGISEEIADSMDV